MCCDQMVPCRLDAVSQNEYVLLELGPVCTGGPQGTIIQNVQINGLDAFRLMTSCDTVCRHHIGPPRVGLCSKNSYLPAFRLNVISPNEYV